MSPMRRVAKYDMGKPSSLVVTKSSVSVSKRAEARTSTSRWKSTAIVPADRESEHREPEVSIVEAESWAMTPLTTCSTTRGSADLASLLPTSARTSAPIRARRCVNEERGQPPEVR